MHRGNKPASEPKSVPLTQCISYSFTQSFSVTQPNGYTYRYAKPVYVTISVADGYAFTLT